MSNLLEQAINTDDGERAAKIIQEALGIESDEVANYVFPKTWPADRAQRARKSASGLENEARSSDGPSTLKVWSSRRVRGCCVNDSAVALFHGMTLNLSARSAVPKSLEISE